MKISYVLVNEELFYLKIFNKSIFFLKKSFLYMYISIYGIYDLK